MRFAFVALAWVVLAVCGRAQGTLLLFQERDGSPARNLTAAELGALGDPLFNLVLKGHVTATKLGEIEELLAPKRENRHVFVVDENIANSRRGQKRRAVLSFSGTQGGETLDTNVMLSVFFDSEDFPETLSFVEGWGWDNHRSRYNYYRLDGDGTPDHRLSWKFRGSSVDADLLVAANRRGTCMACHINGAPVMKELAFPWNNWHSPRSESKALLTTNPTRWPVANHPRLKGVVQNGVPTGGLSSAENLEVAILAAITQFNRRRVNAALAREDGDGSIRQRDGGAEVVEAKRILRSLFFTTEYNIASSIQKSGLHPLGDSPGTGPDEDIVAPNSLFLNANLLAGGTPADYLGLKIEKAKKFSALARVSPQEYKRLIDDSDVRLGGRSGDADFGFLVPEPSHLDNDLVDQLIRRGLVTPQFVAAVVTIDLENPVLSTARAELTKFIPDRYTFKLLKATDDPFAAGRHPDDLTRAVITAIENGHVATGSNAERFLAALKTADPLVELRRQVEAYHDRVKQRLETPATRPQELTRLHGNVIARRRAVLQETVLEPLNETGDRLFPLPSD